MLAGASQERATPAAGVQKVYRASGTLDTFSSFCECCSTLRSNWNAATSILFLRNTQLEASGTHLISAGPPNFPTVGSTSGRRRDSVTCRDARERTSTATSQLPHPPLPTLQGHHILRCIASQNIPSPRHLRATAAFLGPRPARIATHTRAVATLLLPGLAVLLRPAAANNRDHRLRLRQQTRE